VPTARYELNPLRIVQVKLGFKILCRGSSGLSLASNRGDWGSIPGDFL